MLLDFSGILEWAKEAGISVLIIIMIGAIIFFGFKRQIGQLIGTLIILAIAVVIIKNPEDTLIQFAQNIVTNLLPGR